MPNFCKREIWSLVKPMVASSLRICGTTVNSTVAWSCAMPASLFATVEVSVGA
jgi:hypothetical protein